jgi:hypothetical protein
MAEAGLCQSASSKGKYFWQNGIFLRFLKVLDQSELTLRADIGSVVAVYFQVEHQIRELKQVVAFAVKPHHASAIEPVFKPPFKIVSDRSRVPIYEDAVEARAKGLQTAQAVDHSGVLMAIDIHDVQS